MASLISRSLVLATARLLSQAVLMLSPILIVRLLDVSQYGRYRQFTVTAIFLATLASFSIASNIN
jgi:O-antigen/teichoic acid export membrane protein